MPSAAQLNSLRIIREALPKITSAYERANASKELGEQVTGIRNATAAVEKNLADASNSSEHLAGADLAAFEAALLDVAAVLPDIASGVLLAVEGFENGDAIDGVAGLMDTCAQLSLVIGTAIGLSIGSMAGGVGSLPGAGAGAFIGSCVGSVFSMISNILSFFAPKTESLAEELKKVLEDQKAEDQMSKIYSVHRAFLVYAMSLNKSCSDIERGIRSPSFNPNVQQKIIAEINFVEGNGITNYWEVVNWLATHQTHHQWPVILDGVCSAYSIVLIAVVRLVCIVNSYETFAAYSKADENKKRQFENLADTAAAKLLTFGEATKINLDDLKKLRPAARDWGILWSVAHDETIHMGLTNPQFNHQGMSAGAVRTSIAVCSKDQTKPYPAYQAYHVAPNAQLWYWRLHFISNNKQFSQDESRYLEKHLTDVFATTGTSTVTNNLIVWELSNKTKIEAFLRDDHGNQIAPFFSENEIVADGNQKVRLDYVRAVHDPYSYGDDDPAGLLARVPFIVYGLCEDGRILVSGRTGRTNRLLPPPISTPKGIGVDQDYVWVFAEKEFACATHASVVRFAGGAQAAWSKSTAIPDSTRALKCLYPSDDGTLVASDADNRVYSATYSVDRRNHTLNVDKWTQLTGYREKSLEKLPVYCWPQFESLLETLETFAGTRLRSRAARA
jgi:hypothetical protein